MSNRHADWLFWSLFICAAAIQLALISYSPLALSPDEAHYWEWSRHLDWHYYSKGPVIAFLIAGTRHLFGETEFAVRLVAAICSILTQLVLFYVARAAYGSRTALFTYLAFRTSLLAAYTGFIATTDSPALLCWISAVGFAYVTIVKNSAKHWFGFGLSVGIGILAKYTIGILIPAVLVFLVMSPGQRKHFLTLGFWLGIGVLALCLLPVFIWNSEHGWISFLHNSSHFTRASSVFPYRIDYLIEFLGAQFGLVGPIFFSFILAGVLWGWRAWRRGDDLAGFHWCCFVSLLGLCCLLSLTRRIYVNWAFPAYLSGTLLLVHLFVLNEWVRVKLRRWIIPSVGVNAAFSVAASLLLFGFTFGLPGKVLPTKKLIGWRELGEHVNRELDNANIDNAILVTDHYGVASELSFYVEGQPRTYVLNLGGRRMNQYDVWAGWQELKGRDLLIVLKDEAELGSSASHFEAVEPVIPGEQFSISYGGAVIHRFRLFWGRNYDGFQADVPDRF